MRIALLEDEPDQAGLILSLLHAAGHHCQHFSSGREFVKQVLRDTYDLAILDWGLPDMDGLDVLRTLRGQPGWVIPVLFVTARDSEADVVTALDAGADDYMTKPVKRAELMARIGALGRRGQGAASLESELRYPPFSIHTRQGQVTRDGEVVDLTQREFDLTLFLFRNVDRLVSRGYILETVWGTSADLNTRTVDTHASRLRTKLGLTPDSGWRLRSIYHHGYRLERVETGPAAVR